MENHQSPLARLLLQFAQTYSPRIDFPTLGFCPICVQIFKSLKKYWQEENQPKNLVSWSKRHLLFKVPGNHSNTREIYLLSSINYFRTLSQTSWLSRFCLAAIQIRSP
jgi:uncharacterized protein (DUF2225 family)